MAKKKKHVGLTKEELSTTAGFLDDVDVEFTKSKYLVTDYGGKSSAKSVVFESTMVVQDMEDSYAQSWKITGGPEDWEIGDDGDTLIPVSKKAEKGVNVNCKFGQLITSMINAGITEDLLSGEASNFDGLKAHMIRIENKFAMKDEEGNLKKDDVLVVDTIIELPGGEAVEAKDDDGGDDEGAGEDVAKKAEGFVEELLKDKKYKDGVAKKQIPKLAFDKFGGQPDQNDIMELLFSDEWLSDDERPWTFDKGIITK